MRDEELRRRWTRSLGKAPRGTLAVDDTYRSLAAPAVVQGERGSTVSLHEVIGRGGMGTVRRATQHCLGREVAVKALSAAVDGSTASARGAFLAEALLSGRLQHPNIVPVHELRERDGELLLVMRRVEGETWAQQLCEEQRPLEEHLEILAQICNPVAYAHSRGVLHLDIKPSNVMLGSFGEVFLMDWGLAACTGGTAASTGLRVAAAIQTPCGTPCYLPPELAQGDGPALGPWSDVYLLGAVLYQLLTGRPPRAGRDFLEVIRAAAEGTLPPLERALPEELRGLLQASLAKEPRERPSAREFQRRLREHLRHRESLYIALRAAQNLERCLPQDPLQEPAELYEQLVDAVAGFRQAQALWKDNPDAHAGELRAREAYVRLALRQGDLGLAETQLQRLPASPTRRSLAAQLHEVRAARAARARRQRRLRLALTVLPFVLLLGVCFGFERAREQAAILRGQQETLLLHNQTLETRLHEKREQAEQERQQAEQQLMQQQALNRRLQRELAALQTAPGPLQTAGPGPSSVPLAEGRPGDVASEPRQDAFERARGHIEQARFDLAVLDFRSGLASSPEQGAEVYLAASRAASLASQFPAAEPELGDQALVWLDAFAARVRLAAGEVRAVLAEGDDPAAEAFLQQLQQGWSFVREEDPAFVQLRTHPQFRQLLEGTP